MDPQGIFKICPSCGAKTKVIDSRKIECLNCDFEYYISPAACCGIIISNPKHQLLLVRRKVEPFKEYLDIPGGFVDFNESFEQATIREVQEELGLSLSVKNLNHFISIADRYEYKNVNYYTIGVIFTAKIGNEKLSPADDISEILWFEKNKVPLNKIAFASIKQTIKNYISQAV